MAQRPDNKIRSARDAFSKGLSAHRSKRIDEAISYYIKSIALNPQDAHVFNNMGVALRKKGLLHKKRTSAYMPIVRPLDLSFQKYWVGPVRTGSR